jgi:hypothetical protein
LTAPISSAPFLFERFPSPRLRGEVHFLRPERDVKDFVIAGHSGSAFGCPECMLDPAIHAEPRFSMDHRVKPGGDERDRHCEARSAEAIQDRHRRFWTASLRSQ